MGTGEEKNWDIVEYQEAMATFRHYSSIRFVVLTLYSTATAGLIYLTLTRTPEGEWTFIDITLIALGIMINYVMYDAETRVSGYLKDISETIESLRSGRGHITNLHDAHTDSASGKFIMILGAVFIVWVMIFFFKFGNLVSV